MGKCVRRLDRVLKKKPNVNYKDDEGRDDRLNDFDQVNRLDDTCVAVRPNLKPFYEVKKVLEDAGGVCADAFSATPTIKPDGSIKGGPKSELRAYELGEEGSYSV